MDILIHDYAGHPFQVQLSRELARRGHLVVHAYAGGLLTPRGSLQKKPDDPATLELLEVPMDPNYRRDKYRFVRRRQMEVRYGYDIAALIRERKPNLVISGNTPTEPQLEIAKACSQAGISFVPWIQDFYCIAVEKLAKKKLPVIGHCIGWWYRHLERMTLRRASSVIAITADFLPLLQELGVNQERVVVIPNWAPLEEVPLCPKRNAWSTRHGLNDKFIFLYSGTLAMKHNPELLWQLAMSFADDAVVEVVVVSEGPGADYLQRKLADSIKEGIQVSLRVLPFQPFSEVPEMLAQAEVLVAILEEDAGIFSVPSKVLTYHCAGKPLLAAMPSDNLASNIIGQVGSGICVSPKDMTGFLSAAKKLRRDAALRKESGEKARNYAEKNFDVKKIASQFEAIMTR